jgi:YegS/Rv2252/BmrU family lipid kinase
MALSQLGRTLVIANPTAHSGRGAAAADFVERFFSAYSSRVASGFEMYRTAAPLDATRKAACAEPFDTVVALGGDGVIHEVVNGLMRIDEVRRPTLAVIPMGSGNDFARTIGATFNDPDRALSEMMGGRVERLDLGRVSADGGEPVYFVETLSFGRDAAIALDTSDRRARGTSQEGAGLFASSGIKLLLQSRGGWSYRAVIDGEEMNATGVMFAVQNGPTYGGGFRIAPAASPVDGLLDVCLSTKAPGVPRALALFGLARFGRHVGSRIMRSLTARRIRIDFDADEVPCQVDGERLEGSSFEIEAVPAAVGVVVPDVTRFAARELR